MTLYSSMEHPQSARRAAVLFRVGFLLFLAVYGCSDAPSEKPELLVAAAVSLKDAFTEIAPRFEKAYPAALTFNFGGSNLLQRQIEAGAPADVFASAAVVQMDALAKQRLILADTRRVFARNTVVLVVPDRSPLTTGAFPDLAGPRVHTVAIGSPEVPVRIYGEEVLRHLSIWEVVRPKCVFGQHARQVLEYVARGEADAGIVYGTDAAINPNVRVLAVAKSEWHREIAYPAAVTAGSRQQALGRRFIDFLTSDAGQAVLRKYGFR